MFEKLSRGDRIFAAQLAAIALLSVVGLIAASRVAERVVLHREADAKCAHSVEFLRSNLSDLGAIITRGETSERDKVFLLAASRAGEAFRYKLYDAGGRVVLASQPDEVGRKNTMPYFRDIVLQGGPFFTLDWKTRSEVYTDALGLPYGEGTRVVGKRYEPIMDGSKLLGVLEVYVDLTSLYARLRAVSRWFLSGLLVMLVLIGGACAASVLRNVKTSRRDLERLAQMRHRAEELAERADSMLRSLRVAEEDKMSRVVSFVDGISHEIANPLSTLGMSLDAIEAAQCADCGRVGAARLAAMRDSLEQIGAFAHALAALSIEESADDAEVDVNEILGNLATLFQLSDRTQGIDLSLDLSPNLESLPPPRRSVSLALFTILDALAEHMGQVRGRIEVSTRMEPGERSIDVRIAAIRRDAADDADAAPGLSPPVGVEPLPLGTARRLVESLAGTVTRSQETGGAEVYTIRLPRRAA